MVWDDSLFFVIKIFFFFSLFSYILEDVVSMQASSRGGPGRADGWAGGGKGALRPELGRPQDHPHWGLTLH